VNIFLAVEVFVMKSSWKSGISFGMTSATITILGLMIGLNSASHSKLVVAGGVLTIAVADAFSDALGMHISQEANNVGDRQVWEATIVTFFTKFIFGLTFLLPLIFIPALKTAVIINIVWGLFALGGLSYIIAKNEKHNPLKVIGEHLSIAIIVLIISNLLGSLIASIFG
jgi:VIT1/CCC1 family predicted Fe2+/Mn2+ transporter